jgi:phospholipid transport system substrate-binding protein
VTTGFVTRGAFFGALLAAAMIATIPSAQAARNSEAEAYVQANATEALRTLGDRSVALSQRQQTFNRLMAQFSDMPRIATFVLGRYGTQLRADQTLRADWSRAFQDYAIAVYETQLERYSGGTIRVVGSIERTPGRDVIVRSEITPRGASRPLPVQWRLLRTGNAWKVVDISLVIDGNEIWMAQQQQRDFLAALDRSNGNIRALMTQIQGQTASMRTRLTASRG